MDKLPKTLKWDITKKEMSPQIGSGLSDEISLSSEMVDGKNLFIPFMRDIEFHRGKADHGHAGIDVELREEGRSTAGVLELRAKPRAAQFRAHAADAEQAVHIVFAKSATGHVDRLQHGKSLRSYRTCGSGTQDQGQNT